MRAKSKNGSGKLTQSAVRDFVKRASAGDVKYGQKLSDSGGLLLNVNRSGSCSWLFRYTQSGRSKDVAIGTYPALSLDAARAAALDMQREAKAGHDLALKRRVERAAVSATYEHSFKSVAERWLEKEKPGWKESHYKRTRRAIERDVYIKLGELPVSQITPALVAQTVSRIADRGVRDTATKILQNVNKIFRYAIALGLCDRNPADAAIEVLPSRSAKAVGHPALLDMKDLHAILLAHEAANVRPDIKLCSLLIAYTAVRIENACAAEWSEVDFKAKVWKIPAAKMKTSSSDHLVPLTDRVISLLQNWRKTKSTKKHIFAAKTKSGYISKEGIEKFYREQLQLRDRHTPHGWRASFSTNAKENGFERDVVEIALHHAHDSAVALAYDRGIRYEKRVKLYEWWSDKLSEAYK